MSIDFPTRSLDVHPSALQEIDRGYLVSWGRPQLLLVVVLTLVLVVALVALTNLVSPFFALGFVVVLPFGAFFVLFFRNPTRRVPQDAGIVVSPADGTVWDVEEVEEGQFVGARCLRIGIFLSVFNVHVNRAPVRGRVGYLQHRDGSFRDARSAAASEINESNSIGIVTEGDGSPDGNGGPAGVKLLVKQISGAIARRIICPAEEGDLWERGGLIGMIKYGSRTELYLPIASGVEVTVQVGDKVCGGDTVVARWPQKGTET